MKIDANRVKNTKLSFFVQHNPLLTGDHENQNKENDVFYHAFSCIFQPSSMKCYFQIMQIEVGCKGRIQK
jgi:hypothetical protein